LPSNQKGHLKLVHSDIDKLHSFLEDYLKFDECKIFKDKTDKKNSEESKDLNDSKHNGATHYQSIIDELTRLLTLTSDIGEGNQHQVIVIAFFGHGGKFPSLILKKLF